MAIIKPRIQGFVTGEYGKTCIIELKDFKDSTPDVSAYTGISVICRSPDGRNTITSTGASFVTDGSDGKIQWSFSSGDGKQLDRPGDWEAQIILTASGKKSKSYRFILETDEGLS